MRGEGRLAPDEGGDTSGHKCIFSKVNLYLARKIEFFNALLNY